MTPRTLVLPARRDIQESEYAELRSEIQSIMTAPQMIMVCGAGTSIAAGLPGFTSSTEFFDEFRLEFEKIANQKVTVKDMFTCRMLKEEASREVLIKLIYRLHEVSSRSQPTAFHRLLKRVDNAGRLARVFTQNIDGIERRSGLTSGIPKFVEKVTTDNKIHSDGPVKLALDFNSDIPRCIPLHGSCHEVRCPLCYEHRSIEDYASDAIRGALPICPRCSSREISRAERGLRQRAVPCLLPAVVLYDETHPHSEAIAEVVNRDIKQLQEGGRSRSVLLVCATSIAIPGIQTIIQAMAKAIKENAHSPSVILINDQEPKDRKWKTTFDLWLKGDIQIFAELAEDCAGPTIL
ncbi:DHS-like NAD/FAD-binding domain-containing protein [Mycena metata]|uniref:DHS-like NAD/FAD-binding domain-containing protein n=1 Tax=Mycena metata TaxID=1033252 RepID=A0AAD7MBU1_9AGAR|nr:DHS-like NAD/FAD-binding domain-containing protein [Mycena metata]